VDRNLALLLWDALLADRQPESAAAAADAEEFFTSRGASAFVRRYRESFVRADSASPGVRGEPGAVPAEGHLDRV
jgi:hypothetical protein